MKKLLFSALAIIGCANYSLGQSVPSYVPTSGLVGWWPFTGNALDSSGNGNHGTVNGATLTTDRFGSVNKAYSFDGIDDFIEILDDNSLNNPNLTVGFWINTNSVIFQQVFYKVSLNTAQNEEYSIPINLNNKNEINLDLKNNSCSPGVGWIYFNNSAALSNWKHVIFTHDGISTKYFLDGNLINSQKANFKIANCPGGSLILGIAWNLQHAFNGSLDDIGIWNRALTQEEITSLYNGSSLGINDVSQYNLFSVYPNPTQSIINVNADNKLIGEVYSILDNTGKVVLSGKINSESTVIGLGNLSGGIYMLSVGENMKNTFKVIKE